MGSPGCERAIIAERAEALLTSAARNPASEQLDYGARFLDLQAALFEQALVVVDLVAAVALGVIERGIGPFDTGGGCVLRQDRGVADADRDGADLRERERLDRTAKPIEGRIRTGRS